jgi:hypothetical protein
MTRLVLVTLVSLLAFGACRDAHNLPTAAKPAVSKSTTHASLSTVCTSYRRKLHILTVQNQLAPTVERGRQISALGNVVTDACN